MDLVDPLRVFKSAIGDRGVHGCRERLENKVNRRIFILSVLALLAAQAKNPPPKPPPPPKPGPGTNTIS
jgi:hypothetical protein